MVLRTISSDERRELERAAGELMKLGAEPASMSPGKTDGTAIPAGCGGWNISPASAGMAVPEGFEPSIRLFNRITV
jgi:hypothetical protein